MSLTKVLHAKISFWGMCTLQKISGWHFSILTFSYTRHFPSFLVLGSILVRKAVLAKKNNCLFTQKILHMSTQVQPHNYLLTIKLFTNNLWITIAEYLDKIILTLLLKTEKRWAKAAQKEMHNLVNSCQNWQNFIAIW